MKPKAIGLAVALAFAATSAWASTVRDERIEPIESHVPERPELVEVGKKLFFELRLSMSGIISCNTCHNLSPGGTDGLKTSTGHKWAAGPVNASTVFNSSLALAQE